MARILFNWELGGGYGHISNFLNLGLRLRERGHEVLFALKDLSRAENLLGSHGFQLLQAPLWLPQPVGVPPPGNYSEILFSFGYFDEAGLTGVVRAWRGLFGLIDADLLVMENSPTALLAARGLSTPRALLGTGFSCPPPEKPMPVLRWWQSGVRYHFDEHENNIVRTMNGVLRRVGGPQLETVADLFAADETFLSTFPELDHYPARGDRQRYWGPAFNIAQGSPPRWPMGKSKKLFAYLDANHPGFVPAIKVLRGIADRVLVHAAGASERVRRDLESATLAFTTTAANMQDVLSEADLIVCHSGHGLSAAALLAGRPLLLIPAQVEQYMLAQRIEQLGAGRIVGGGRTEKDLRKLVAELLTNPGYASAALEFAQRHKQFRQQDQIDAVVGRMEQLASMERLRSANAPTCPPTPGL